MRNLMASDEMGRLFPYLVNSYKSIQENEFQPKRLMELDLSDGAHFYEQRMHKIEEYLNLDFSYGAFKENALYNHILALTTVRLIDLKQSLCQFIDYSIGGIVVGIVPFSIAMHFIIGIISLVSCKFIFVKRAMQ